MKNKKTPMRMCLGCRESKPKQELVRVVRSPEGELKLDTTGRMAGRGAYLCRSADCLRKSIRSRALSRALEVSVSDEFMEKLAGEIGE